MREILELGSAPVDEKCAQVGDEDYAKQAVAECRAYVNQLYRVYEEANVSPVPPGLRLHGKRNDHEYGVYYEVAAFFNDTDEEAVNAAYWLEANQPPTWDEKAKVELASLKEKE